MSNSNLASSTGSITPQGSQIPTDSLDHPTVFNRLTALFSSNAEAGPSRPRDEADGIFRAVTEPVGAQRTAREVKDRNALVLKLVTWNMGDALPKGDLSVLLGKVPDYTPLETEDGVPVVPIEDSHPYHLVVVAGQECPTESGAPRGIGGVRLKGRKFGDKRKDKEGKGPENDLEELLFEAASVPRTPFLGAEDHDNSGGSVESSRATSPSLAQGGVIGPQPHRHQNVNTKGWSTMLDDWLCGPIPRSDKEKQNSLEAPQPSKHTNFLHIEAPILHRSNSAPQIIQSPVSIPPSNNISHGKSPLARYPSSSEASSSDEDNTPMPVDVSIIPIKPPKSPELKTGKPGISINTEESSRTIEGNKCYLHLTKQRLMGMYLSIYVHKDCRHLVGGVDKDYVTAGLAGGRLGNKGGIGISIKFAGHRLLFVNAHLAAHTSRNASRMANIAKIKAELRLNSFLPREDPRSHLPDITDRFDSTFWCGDLNFRLDVARLHAEWLVEQKKFEEALTWDQLKNAMKHPETNPLPGFLEGPINFPPTFKYDVWKSIRTTNKNLRKSLRRQNSLRAASVEPGSSLGATSLGQLAEADAEVEAEAIAEQDEETMSRISDDDLRSLRSVNTPEPQFPRMSYDSAAPSIIGTDPDSVDLDEGGRQAVLNGQLNSQRPLDATLKEKTKKVFSLMKLKNAFVSPKKDRSIANSRKLSSKPSTEFDEESRRTSLSTNASRVPSPEIPSQPRFIDNGLLSPIEPKIPQDSYFSIGQGRRPSTATAVSTVSGTSTSPQKRNRAFSLKRTLSGRSAKLGSSLDDEDLDMEEDRREGRYDTSKKQRVPSWCDRVLWKAHPVPDPPEKDDIEEEEMSEEEDAAQVEKPRFGRLSMAFANLGFNLKSPAARSIGTDGSDLNTALPHDHSDHLTLVESPPTELHDQSSLVTPSVKRNNTAPHTARSITIDSYRADSPTRVSPRRHPLLQRSGSHSGPPARPHITIDPASSPSKDRLSRQRANSDTTHIGTISRDMLNVPAPGQKPSSAVSSTVPSPMPSRIDLKRGASSSSRNSTNPLSFKDRSRTLSLRPSNTQDGEKAEKEESGGGFARFLRDLLHRGSVHEAPLPIVEVPPPIKPRRHMRGEVVCLGYGTIDDAGMRMLEGRSDHRPAIFSAAIYV